MSRTNSTLTQERLKELLHYDAETGVFRHLTKTTRRNVGDIADSLQKEMGRYRITVNGRRYFSHRLAWLYMTGEWPKNEIDHIDGNPTNNAITNLRDVIRSVNCENRHGPQTDNKSGFLGVFWEKRFHVWIAKVTVKRKSIHIGTFETPEEAHAAYLEAKRKLHSGCTI